MRARPSTASLAWVEHVLDGQVCRCRARRGGRSSAVHELWVEDRHTGRTSSVVLRAYVVRAVLDEEPDIVEREARGLTVLEAATGLATPRLLAIDADGSASGTPSLLMSRLPGRVDWSPRGLERWMVGLAEALAPVHALPVPMAAAASVPDFRPYEPASWEPPPWLTDPSSWDRAVRLFHASPADQERAVIHRDYHPGNVLWRRGRVSGVVDWQALSVGPTAVDATHCKLNLLVEFGAGVADRFVTTWEVVTGRSVHPWAEVVLLVDAIGGGWAVRREHAEAFDAALRRSLSALG